MRAFVLAGMVLFAGSVLAADKEKPLTAAQKKAVAKYDHLPDKWRDKAVEAWKKEFKVAGTGRARLLKNDPPWYPEIVSHDARGDSQLLADSWGIVGLASVDDKPGETPGVYVFQVVSKSRAILKLSDKLMYFVDGIDTSDLVDQTVCKIPGVFHVVGNDTYTTLAGTTNTIRVVKPIPTKADVKSK